MFALSMVGCDHSPAQTRASKDSDKAREAEAAIEPPAAAKAAKDERAAEDQSKTTDDPPAPVAPQVRRMIALYQRGPLVVHLELSIDGKDPQAMGEQILNEATQAAGAADGDARWEALVAAPRFASGRFGNTPTTEPAQRQQVINQFDGNRDGRVQRSEVAACLAQDNAEGQLFSVSSTRPYGDAMENEAGLFQLLDQDSDGRLSTAEMADARWRLRSRDADDDEVVTLADFRAPAALDRSMRNRQPARAQQVFQLNKLEIESIYYAMCEFYATQRGLDAKSFSLTPKLFAQLDTDHNDVVNQPELSGLLEARADLTLKIRFSSGVEGKPTPPSVEVQVTSDDLPPDAVRLQTSPTRVLVDMAEGQLDVSLVDLAPPAPAADTQFKMLDVDNDGFLDGKEAEKLLAMIGQSLEALDRDNDGKISLDEARTALDRSRLVYSALQTQVRVDDSGDALFAWLDVNSDGRLTPREIESSTQRLAQLGPDEDAVTAARLPDRLRWIIVRGIAGRDAALYPAMSDPRGGLAGVPKWLSSLDTNGDGEISPREFLGTPEQFATLDINADGFLEANELKSLADASPSGANEDQEAPKETAPP
jgi:Ca2+-binding EF-hand superfamily protein